MHGFLAPSKPSQTVNKYQKTFNCTVFLIFGGGYFNPSKTIKNCQKLSKNLSVCSNFPVFEGLSKPLKNVKKLYSIQLYLFFEECLAPSKSKRAARTTRPTSVLDGTKPIGERGKNSRPCLIVSQAAYPITRIPDIGLSGRAVREPIWSQYFPPLSNLCW